MIGAGPGSAIVTDDAGGPDGSRAVYRKATGVSWAVEADELILSNGQGTVRRLGYPKAAVWDLISRGYPFDKVVTMMTFIAAVDADQARALVVTSLAEWVRAGYLCRDGEHG